MTGMQKEIQNDIRNEIEIIESERYNSKDPIVKIEKPQDPQHVITKLIVSERTGAPLKLKNEIIYPAEDLAVSNFYRGISTMNSWQFKNCKNYLNEAANKASAADLQQRINLFKQLAKLLEAIIKSTPEKSIRRTQKLFDDIISSIKKYDKLSPEERTDYNKQVESLYNFAIQLDNNNLEIQTQQLYARCSMALLHNEYLAAYVWLHRIYLLNKEMFDTIAEKDNILRTALDNLRLYLEVETGLKEQLDDLPTMASSYDLQTIFNDHLTEIYDCEFMLTTKDNLSFTKYKGKEE